MKFKHYNIFLLYEETKSKLARQIILPLFCFDIPRIIAFQILILICYFFSYYFSSTRINVFFELFFWALILFMFDFCGTNFNTNCFFIKKNSNFFAIFSFSKMCKDRSFFDQFLIMADFYFQFLIILGSIFVFSFWLINYLVITSRFLP